MAKMGRTLEKLVAVLEKFLEKSPAVRVESPYKVKDRGSLKQREIDVALFVPQGPRTLLVAFECKDYKDPVGVEKVEGFATKIRDTDVDKGVIVSSNGFTEGALNKARAHSIDCLTLKEVEDFDWLKLGDFISYTPDVVDTFAQFNTAKPYGSWASPQLKNGLPISMEELDRRIVECINRERLWVHTEGDHVLEETLPLAAIAPGLTIDTDIGRVPVVSIYCRLRYHMKKELLPVKRRSYVDVSSGKQIASVASVALPGNSAIHFVVKENSDGTKSLAVKHDLGEK